MRPVEPGLGWELEFTRDGVVTGFIVKVQIKSGASYLRNKPASGFDYHASASDFAYWSKVGFPVILVVYDPDSQAGYWLDVNRDLNQHDSAAILDNPILPPQQPPQCG
ncbi:MAG TPA: DUF4365 domain-containing protein [Bryobacteraceae bacterium]|nr:DUF4365 domain-containing protein [Bryobacteraceae bacterium]